MPDSNSSPEQTEKTKDFLRKKLAEGVSPEKLREKMQALSMDSGLLDSVLNEKNPKTQGSAQQITATAPQVSAPVPSNEASVFEIILSDRSVFINPIIIESIFFILFITLWNIPTAAILAVPLAIAGAILISFDTYRICKKCVQDHYFNFIQSVLLSFTQALIVATIFLFAFIGIFILFVNVVFPAFFPGQLETLLNPSGYPQFDVTATLGAGIFGLFILAVIVLFSAVIYRILLSFILTGVLMNRNQEQPKEKIIKKDDSSVLVLAGVTLVLVIVLDAVLAVFVFYNFSASGALGGIITEGELYDEFGNPKNPPSSYGFSSFELKDGLLTGYSFDSNISSFSLTLQYNKAAPAVLDLSSISFSNAGKICITIPFERFSRTSESGYTSESSFAKNQKVELEKSQTLTIAGVMGKNCGMVSRDYNFDVSFSLTEKDTNTLFREQGKIKGVYFRVNEKDAIYFRNLAYYNWMTYNYSEAEKNYLEALKLQPNTSAFLLELASVYFEIEDYNKAADLIGSVIQAKSNDSELQFLGGLANFKKGDYEKAKEYFENALELDPSDYFAMDYLFGIYLKQEKYAEGQQLAEKFALETNNYLAYHYAGVFSAKLEDYEKAETNLKKALSINPKYFWSIDWLESAYANEKKYDDMIALAEQALVDYPEDAKLLYWLGYAQYYKQRFISATTNLEKSVAKEPNSIPNAWLLLSYSYQETGQDFKASQALQKYNELKAG